MKNKYVLTKNVKTLIVTYATIAAITLTGCATKAPTIKSGNQATTSTLAVTSTQNQSVISEELTFDPNNRQVMVSKIAGLYADALSKGIKGIEIEDWISFYTVLNIKDINFENYIPIQDGSITANEILAGYDRVANALHDDFITMTAKSQINIAAIIANKESAKEFAKFQSYMAEYNDSTNKKETATKVNSYINEAFIKENNNVESATEALEIKLLSAEEKLSINNNRIPQADYSKIIFGIGESCNMTTAVKSTSKFSIKRDEVIDTLTEVMLYAKQTKTEADKYSLTDIVKEIKNQLLSQSLVYYANPDMEQVLNTNKTTNDKYPTVGSNDRVVKNPVTGKEEIRVPISSSEYKDQKETIESSVAKENENAILQGNAIRDGKQNGWDQGRIDGKANNAKNYTISATVLAKYGKYADLYKSNYKEYYDKGWANGQLEYNETHETVVVITPVTTTQATPTPKPTATPTPKPTTVPTETTTTTIKPVDGYYFDKDGNLIDAKTGLPVRITTSAQVLTEYRDYLVSLQYDNPYVRTRL